MISYRCGDIPKRKLFQAMSSFVFETHDWWGICFFLSLVDMSGKLRHDKWTLHQVHAISYQIIVDKACLRVPHIDLCQRQLEDFVVEDWWLFPRNLFLFWMRKTTKQRGSKASPYSDGNFPWIARVIWLKYISPYVLAYLYPTEFHYKITTLIKKRWS